MIVQNMCDYLDDWNYKAYFDISFYNKPFGLKLNKRE